MIYSFSFSCKISQIIAESVAISIEDQFNNYIHVHCENPTTKSFVPFLFTQWRAFIRNTMFLTDNIYVTHRYLLL